MIPESVRNRLATYYFFNAMKEDFADELVDALTTAIYESDEQISEDELVNIGIRLIKEYLDL